MKFYLLGIAVGLLIPAAASADMVSLPETRWGMRDEVSIPIVLEQGLAVADLSVSVAFVERADFGAFPSFVKAAHLRESTPAAPELKLTLELETVAPGVYTVGLSFADQGKATKPRHPAELKKIELVRTAAKLSAPAKVSLNCMGSCRESTVPVWIREVSKAAEVSNVSLRWSLSEAPSAEHPPGTLECTSRPNVTLPAGGQVQFECKPIAGAPFSLGTTTGTLSVMGEPLAEIVSIPVEIRTRRHWWWVPVLITIGVALGLILRGALTRWLSNARDRAEADRLCRLLQAARDVSRDGPYGQRLDTSIRRLIEASTVGAELRSAIAAASKEKGDADADLQARFAATAQRVKDLETQFDRPGVLPDALENSVEEVKRLVGESRAALEQGDVATAQKHAEHVERLERVIVARASDWGARLHGRIARLGVTARKDFGEAVRERLKRLDAAQTAKAAISASADVLRLDPILEHELEASTADLEKALRCLEDTPALDPGKRGAPAVQKALHEPRASDTFEGRLAQLAAHGVAREVLAPVVDQAASSRASALAPVRARFDELREAGRYGEALELIITPQHHQGDAAPIARPFGAYDDSTAPAAAVEPIANARSDIDAPNTVSVPHPRLVQGVEWAVTLLAGSGVIALGTVLYLETFIGRPQEVAELVAWGFTANVSVEALVTTATQLRRGT